ncbi:MAG: heat-inducible transcription repressor HrcA [Candidatus Rokubacteria bacterium]|nr:heat-inducible transcription repressor HrcA [Candidatus Rokubacteria bacterium]
MVEAELGERSRQVLEAVIVDYTLTAEPVGSRAVSRKYHPDLSPATIRNAMADLEELGYLSQPHPSAGRVPTDKAYRFYVDRMKAQPLSRTEATRLNRQVGGARSELDELMEHASLQLSSLSRYTGVVLAPPLSHTRLERVDLLPVGGERALAVVVTETGWVTSRTITLGEPLRQLELREIARLITEGFGGLTFQEIQGRLDDPGPPPEERLGRLALTLAEKVFALLRDRNLYIGGAINILDQPEFADLDTMRMLLKAFEEKRRLIELFSSRAEAEGVRVVIGSENPYEEMHETSVVTAVYKYGNHILGSLGVVGPRRMRYAKVVALVDYTAKLVSRRLDRLARAEPSA